MSELGVGTRRALAACLYDAGFTGVARLIAEDTTDVFEMAGSEDDWTDTVIDAVEAAHRSGRAQLVLVTPDGEGEWLKPELVGTVEASLARNRGVGYVSTDASGLHAREYPPSTPQVLDIMRQTLERGR